MRAKINLQDKVEIFPYKKKIVTSKELLKMSKNNFERVENIKFVIPKLGTKSLGKFIVEYEW